MTRHVGKHNIFKARLTEIMKKYRKGFRELKMRERWKRIDIMAREVMCCCLGRDNLSGEVSMKDYIYGNIDLASDILNFLSAVQGRIERHMGLKTNMMIQRDTETRDDDDDDDDDDGLVKEADEKSKQAAVCILSVSTGQGYKQIQKSIANVCNVKLPSKYIMDKERPVVEKMEIVPAGSSYDECVLQSDISDINCTSEGEPATALSLSARMPSGWSTHRKCRAHMMPCC